MGTYDSKHGSPLSPNVEDNVTPLQEQVLALLEESGIPQETNDAIVYLIADAEGFLEGTKIALTTQHGIAERPDDPMFNMLLRENKNFRYRAEAHRKERSVLHAALHIQNEDLLEFARKARIAIENAKILHRQSPDWCIANMTTQLGETQITWNELENVVKTIEEASK